ncbi:MAG TPA: FHA domain-containing protein [Pirellulaceae bacterium]|nr:FHA domain-containing protein [Pirellulaceae bacterium]
MKIKLFCTSALASPREVTIDRFPIEIGRGVNAGVRIDDRWISRRHCELVYEAGSIVVRDLSSRHGTMVNGQPISESPLADGDTLQLGLTPFQVSVVAPPNVHDSAEFAAVM